MCHLHSHKFLGRPLLLLEWEYLDGVPDAEMRFHFVENPLLSMSLFLKVVVGQNTALHARISAFFDLCHADSFSFNKEIKIK